MALASDLMGFGVSPLQAQRTANGGNGPVNIAAAAGGTSTGYKLGGAQYFTNITGGTGAVVLPPIGGDNGALIADDFIILNNSGNTITLFANTSGSIQGYASGFSSTINLTTGYAYQFWATYNNQWLYK